LIDLLIELPLPTKKNQVKKARSRATLGSQIPKKILTTIRENVTHDAHSFNGENSIDFKEGGIDHIPPHMAKIMNS
jgi:hypothetical protein